MMCPKREDLLPVFSFKLRGAYNKMAHLPPHLSWKGVIACSAGNHAQGVAYSARHLKIPATIVMPQGTPAIKHMNVSRMGGSVVLHGPDFDSAKEHCQSLEKQYASWPEGENKVRALRLTGRGDHTDCISNRSPICFRSSE